MIYGVFSVGGGAPAVGARVGDAVIDLGALARAGLYDGFVADAVDVFCAASLNRLLARGYAVWRAARERTLELIANPPAHAVVPLSAATMHLPIEVADYVDFYASIEHATNLGRLFRPDGDPLLPNYRWIPIGYHGRAGTVVVSGTPVVRPSGQRKPPDAAAPTFGPSRMLDFELEVGFITGDGPPLGTPIAADRARDYIFGLVLLNDWSARDIQAWDISRSGRSWASRSQRRSRRGSSRWMRWNRFASRVPNSSPRRSTTCARPVPKTTTSTSRRRSRATR